MSRRLLHFNGICAETGRYLMPPKSLERFAEELRGREIRLRLTSKGVMEGIDGSNLDEAGWGIVVPEDLDDSIRESLEELVRYRANPYLRWLTYLPGETVSGFLARHGASHGLVEPRKIPFYLLLIGSPEQIPFTFQADLDVQYAVGRLDLEGSDAYCRYASTLAKAEKDGLRRRRAVFFGVENPKDPSTELSARCLVGPLATRCTDLYPDWEIVHHSGPAASKAALYRELHGEARPALVFTAGHAVFYSLKHAELQRQRQGALLMSDWPGPQDWDTPVTREQYFAADDIEDKACLQGLITFHFACFSGGTPERDSFCEGQLGSVIAPAPFIARLPQAMLSHRQGTALAVIAHVDRAWEASFLWDGQEPQVAVFETALRRLLDGNPVGLALEAFGQRYAELAVHLHTHRMEMLGNGLSQEAAELGARLWTAVHDARGYVLLGDPAARLSLEE